MITRSSAKPRVSSSWKSSPISMKKSWSCSSTSRTFPRSSSRRRRATPRSRCSSPRYSAAPPTRTRACRSSWTRSSIIFPRPSTWAPWWASTSTTRKSPIPATHRQRTRSAALAFKLIHDPYVGQQTFIRIYSGKLKSGMQVYNSTQGRNPSASAASSGSTPRSARRYQSAGPGDIVALIGMKYTKTGDTLCDSDHPLCLESIFIPPSVIELKVRPPSKKEEEKLGAALRKLTMEDPSFTVRVRRRNQRDHHRRHGRASPRDHHRPSQAPSSAVEAIVGEPSVAFRETITTEVECE